MKFKKGDKCRILRSDTGMQHKDKCGQIVTIIGPPKLGFSPELEYPTSAGYGLIMESRLELVEAAKQKTTEYKREGLVNMRKKEELQKMRVDSLHKNKR